MKTGYSEILIGVIFALVVWQQWYHAHECDNLTGKSKVQCVERHEADYQAMRGEIYDW